MQTNLSCSRQANVCEFHLCCVDAQGRRLNQTPVQASHPRGQTNLLIRAVTQRRGLCDNCDLVMAAQGHEHTHNYTGTRVCPSLTAIIRDISVTTVTHLRARPWGHGSIPGNGKRFYSSPQGSNRL
jgi:hypothetical protein